MPIVTCAALPGRVNRWELSEKVPFNIKHIKERLIQTFSLVLALWAVKSGGRTFGSCLWKKCCRLPWMKIVLSGLQSRVLVTSKGPILKSCWIWVSNIQKGQTCYFLHLSELATEAVIPSTLLAVGGATPLANSPQKLQFCWSQPSFFWTGCPCALSISLSSWWLLTYSWRKSLPCQVSPSCLLLQRLLLLACHTLMEPMTLITVSDLVSILPD